MRRLYSAIAFAAFAVTPAVAQIAAFRHIVVVVQENRTPDNMFQGLCSPPYGTATNCSATPSASQYNIQTSNWRDATSPTGVTQPFAVSLQNNYVPQITHSDFATMCDWSTTLKACRMDGAARSGCQGTCPAKPQFAYVNNDHGVLDPYLDLATEYGFANYMFQTNQGPSYPAHQFLFGGTSAPSAADDAKGIFVGENVSELKTAGCTADAGNVVQLITPEGETSNARIYPCFEHETIPDLLSSAHTWRYYSPLPGSIWTAPNSIQHICQSTGPGGECVGPEWTANIDTRTAGVLEDIAACKLSDVSWVIPTGQNSDHPWQNDGGGPSWVASIVNAVGASTACDKGSGYWKDTAIIVTWDDWGGWYDHAAPPVLPGVQGDYQLGFRVPMIFVSAYTPAGFIGQTQIDFGAVLRFIEHNFGIAQGALQFADQRANNDLSGYFNLSRAPRTFGPIKAPRSAAFFLNDTRAPLPPDNE